MRQQDFEDRYTADWGQLEKALATPKTDVGPHFPQQYRRLCHQLALAKHRRYSPQLVNRLNRIVLQSHHRLYQHKQLHRSQLLQFVARDFPVALRNHRYYIYGAALLFVLPLLVMGIACYFDEELIFSMMPSATVEQMEDMYDPARNALGRQRESDTDLMMFGYYIKNNIGVSFRTFAGGVLFGLGSIFFLVYNGLHIGAIAGHLTRVGYGGAFYPFVVGHGAFELTAIVFSGAAGLKLGFALLMPGSYRRLDALRGAAREAAPIVYGAMLMLVLAAFLEAFWSSSSTLPTTVKYGVGALFWSCVTAYCLFAGKAYGPQSHPD